MAKKRGATRLGFALLLKFYELEGRFPRHAGEVPKPALGYIAAQVKVAAAAFSDYEWTGRTIEYHRAQIRRHLGFRECTADDAVKLTGWLADGICQTERRGRPGAGGVAGTLPRGAGRAALGRPLRPDYPLGPASG